MKIGYIGLGALGGALARRFLADHELTIWDLNPASVAALEQLGATSASSAAELARRCDVVLLCLPRSSDVSNVLFAAGGLAEALQPGSLVIDQTSGVPTETRRMAERLAGQGVDLMDASVSASPQIVGSGGATLMASASDEVYARALPVLHAITKTVYRCGARVGDGQAMKMVNNAMNGGCRLGTLEVVALGRKLGLSLECMSEVLNRGPGANQTTLRMLPALVEGKASTDFALSLMLKDISQAVSLGMDFRVPMPVSSTVRAVLQIGVNTLGPTARLEDVVGLTESMAGAQLAGPADPARAEVSAAPAGQAKDLTVGFVGLTSPGTETMRRLSGVSTLHVFDPDPALLAEWTGAGAIAAADIASLARACDVIMLSMPTPAETRQVVVGGLTTNSKAGQVVVDLAATDPAQTRALATELQAFGVALVDAPFAPRPVGMGIAPWTCGGPPEAYGQVRPLLDAIGTGIIYCGTTGTGAASRAVSQAVEALNAVITYECAAAGLKYGLTLGGMAEVLVKTSGWSEPLRRILPNLAAGRRMEGMPLRSAVDDLQLAGRLAIDCGAPTLILNAVRSTFELGANELGVGAELEAIVGLYEHMTGASFAST